jgi:hypothetical protein
MGVRTRGLDMRAGFKRDAADRAARADAKAVVDRWNEQLAAGRDMLWPPTIRAALLAGTHWLDVFCPGCGTSLAIDLRTIDRHPLASVGTLVLGLRCSWCPGLAPMPKLLGLFTLPPARWADAAALWHRLVYAAGFPRWCVPRDASGLITLTANRRRAPQVTVRVDQAVLRAID